MQRILYVILFLIIGQSFFGQRRLIPDLQVYVTDKFRNPVEDVEIIYYNESGDTLTTAEPIGKGYYKIDVGKFNWSFNPLPNGFVVLKHKNYPTRTIEFNQAKYYRDNSSLLRVCISGYTDSLCIDTWTYVLLEKPIYYGVILKSDNDIQNFSNQIESLGLTTSNKHLFKVINDDKRKKKTDTLILAQKMIERNNIIRIFPKKGTNDSLYRASALILDTMPFVRSVVLPIQTFRENSFRNYDRFGYWTESLSPRFEIELIPNLDEPRILQVLEELKQYGEIKERRKYEFYQLTIPLIKILDAVEIANAIDSINGVHAIFNDGMGRTIED